MRYSFIVVFFLFLFISYNCKQEKRSILSVELVKVTYDHVVKRRDWCRFSNIIVIFKLTNQSNSLLILPDPVNIDYCNIEKVNPDFIIKLSEDFQDGGKFRYIYKNKEINLVLQKIEGNRKLSPGKSVLMEGVLFPLMPNATLKDYYQSYEPIFNSNLYLDGVSLSFKNEKILKNNDKYETVLMLDDLIVNQSDSLRMNTSNNPPFIPDTGSR